MIAILESNEYDVSRYLLCLRYVCVCVCVCVCVLQYVWPSLNFQHTFAQLVVEVRYIKIFPFPSITRASQSALVDYVWRCRVAQHIPS